MTTWTTLLLGLAVAGSAWANQMRPPTTAKQAGAAAAEPSVERPARGPGAVVNQPQTEAATLKATALEVARRVAESYPKDALSYALLGSAYYNTGRSKEAIRELNKCLRLNPNLAEAYDILARIAYEKGQLDETIRLCNEALQHGPANSEVLNQLGQALMDRGQTREAIQKLEQAVHLPDPTGQSNYLLGQARLQAGDYVQAKQSFRQTIALVPDHTQAYFGLYTACLRLGQTEEATRYRDKFQKLEATDQRSLSNRSAREDTLSGLPMVHRVVAKTLFGAAQVYRAHRQTAKAEELLRKSAALDGDNPAYRAVLEAFYVQNQALAEGVAAFEQLVAEQPKNTLNHFFLGRLHDRLGHFTAAEGEYREVQKLAPQWAEGYRSLARLYLRSNRKPAEARVLARRVVELEPTGAHYYLLAVACAKNDDRPGALQALRRAVALSPNETKYQRALEQLRRAP